MRDGAHEDDEAQRVIATTIAALGFALTCDIPCTLIVE
jgi:hypothetical protein